jgi:hypothetical protein
VDLRGLWESPDGHVERIEQCGLRIIVTSSGVIHDTYIANGREEDGVDDVQGGTCDPIIVAGLFHSENQSFVFYQNGAAVVSRQLIGADTLRWIHPTAGTVDYARATGTSTAADGIYYGNPDGPTLSTFYHRYGTPGCNTGTTPSVPSEDLASSPTPDEAPLMLDGCTQPIAPSAVDMRGLWYSDTQGYMRIEQCGLRIIITTSTIHDCYIANGRLADGVFDMNSANCSAINNNCRFFNDTQTVTFYASDADATNNVNPEVSRQLLDENTIQVIHSQFGTSNYSRVGSVSNFDNVTAAQEKYGITHGTDVSSLTDAERASIAANIGETQNYESPQATMIFVNVDSTSQYYGINFNGSRVADITDFGDTDKAVVQVVSIDNVTNDGSIASTASHQLIIDRFNTSGATQNAQSINFTMYVSDSDAQVWYYNSSGWTEISTEGGTAEYNSSGGAINVVASHTSTFIAATATTDDDSDDGLWGLMALLALPLGICAFFLIKKKRASKAKGSRFVTYAPPYNVVVNDPYMHRFGPPANTPVNVQQPFMYGKMGPYMGPPPPNMPVYARPY